MSTTPLPIRHLVYGSFSGERNFRILADTGDLERDERDVIRHYSNLGGSAQTDEVPEPIFTAYQLGGGTVAFSRTLFLGAGGRGNDYLAHVLLLDPDLLGLLRGDLFLLADPPFGLFREAKPGTEDTLAPLEIDPLAVEEASTRPCGSDGPFAPGELTGLLRALAGGPLAVPVREARSGAGLCRAALSLLPPDDRRRFAFTSRFSQPRRVRFDLAVHLAADSELVADGLVDHRRFGADLSADLASGDERDPFARWTDRAAGGTLEPLVGLSLLREPETAVATADTLDRWIFRVEAGHDSSDLLRYADTGRLPVVDVAAHPLNRRLPRTGLLHLQATLDQLLRRTREAFGSDAPFTALRTACLEAAREAPVDKLCAEVRRRLRSGRTGGAGRPEEAAAAVVLAVEAGTPPMTTSKGAAAEGSDALWTTPEDAGPDLAALAAVSPHAFLGVTSAWFTARQRSVGLAAVDELVPLVKRLAEAPEPALGLAIQALEQAAPPAGAAARRRTWFLHMVRRLRAALGSDFPRLVAARLADREDLLEELGAEELEELIPRLADTFPDRLVSRVEGGELPWPVLRRLLFTCTGALLAPGDGGRNSDLLAKPGRWVLAVRVAAAAAGAMTARGGAGRGDRRALAEAVWLVWAAAALPTGVPGDPLTDAGDHLPRALEALIDAGEGAGGLPEADVALRALWRLHHRGTYHAEVSGPRWATLRRQALSAADRSPEASLAAVTRCRVVQLDVELSRDSLSGEAS